MTNDKHVEHIPLANGERVHATLDAANNNGMCGHHVGSGAGGSIIAEPDHDDGAEIDENDDESKALQFEVNGGNPVSIVGSRMLLQQTLHKGDYAGGNVVADGVDVKDVDHSTEPPDGGSRAWLVMISAFLCNSILFGIINTYGTVYLRLQEIMQENKESDASSKAALVGSLCIGITFLLSTVSGILTDRIGLRNTTFIGGILAASGMFLSAVFVHNIVALYFTFGVMFGLGAALAYTPSLSILGHYFKRYLGLANGFVTAGSSVSTALLPQFLEYSIREYSLQYTFCVLGFFSLFIVACSLIYKPLRPPVRLQSFTMPPPPATGDGDADADADNVKSTSAPKLSARCAFVMRSLVNVDNWRRPRYVIWAVSIPVALIGYFVPYVHTPKLVQVSFAGRNVSTPIVCIGIASGVGRMVCGFLADRRCVNRIYLQQISFVAIGLLTMLIPLTSSYTVLCAICTAMGLFDGCFISLLGPVAYEICGAAGAAQAIGFLLGLCSIPLTVGPPIAGMLYDQTNSYRLSYVLAGIPPLIGAAMMCMMRFVEEKPINGSENGGDDDDDDGEADNGAKRNMTDVVKLELGMDQAKPAWVEESLNDHVDRH